MFHQEAQEHLYLLLSQLQQCQRFWKYFENIRSYLCLKFILCCTTFKTTNSEAFTGRREFHLKEEKVPIDIEGGKQKKNCAI